MTTRPIDGSRPRIAVSVPSNPSVTAEPARGDAGPAPAGLNSTFNDAKKKLLSLGKSSTRFSPIARDGGGTLQVKDLQRQSTATAKAPVDAAKTKATPPVTGHGAKSASGKITPEQWSDLTQLVGKLTQFPAKKNASDQSQAACAAANLLGAALLTGGPDAAAAMLKRVASGSTQLTAAETTELNGIAERIQGKTATFEDLNKAQQLLYRSANIETTGKDLVDQAADKLSGPKLKKLETAMKRYLTATIMSRDEKDVQTVSQLLGEAFGDKSYKWDPDSSGSVGIEAGRRTKDLSGLTDDELKSLGATASKGQTVVIDERTNIKDLAMTLKPGESITLRLAGDSNAKTSPNHYVTIGKRPDGTMFLYNPDPSRGDSTLVTGKLDDAKFKDHLGRYQPRLKFERVERSSGTQLEFPRALRSNFN